MARSHGFFADLHTHTTVSAHAYSTVNEYAQFAASVGVRLFAVTNHGPALPDGAFVWHFVNMVVLPRMLYGVALLRGIEANILAEGPNYPLDVDEVTTRNLDLIQAGFHEPCYVSKGQEENTKLLLDTIRSGRVQIITHPGNPRFPIDIQVVAAAAAQCNVALEINNSSFLTSRKGSKDNCFAVAAAVREAGGKLVLGSDSHHSHALCDFTEAVKVLEAVNFPMDRVINTTPEKVLEFLESHGKDLSDVRSQLK